MQAKEEYDIQNKFEYLLYHIVLPRVLPQKKSNDFEHHELLLLSRLNDVIKDCSEWIPLATVRLFNSLKTTHMNRTADFVSKEIRALQPGDTFAMFVRRQNCGLMIYMPIDGNTQADKQETVVVTTFPGNLHIKEIYQHQSDIKVK